jgi:hypothetical protein
MPLPAQLLSALTQGNLSFPENQASLARLLKDDLSASRVNSGILWRLPEDSSAPRVLAATTGHAILYGERGLRILYMDPGGMPLHECAWESHVDPPRLLRARVQLDWGQWVGIKPEGLVNVARFDISQKPGWQGLTKNDLHRMAAQAMGVSPDEVAFFYDEESLKLDAKGQVTIRQRKDALYVLQDGGFDQARFMACMGAMHWGRIDFLPVVELFQSLLAGTGSAVFELIRGLYDDQNSAGSPRVLRYRGIPTYPSPQAFQLFSTYFTPEAPGSADPFSLFMDPARSAEVTWRPRSDPPHRFMDQELGLSVTVSGGVLQKVTKRNDPVALPYTRPTSKGAKSGNRLVGTTMEALELQDGDWRETIPLKQVWSVIKESPLPQISAGQTTWRSLFPEGVPHVDPGQAYLAVPLYPEDDAIVEEFATQPVAIEQILEYLEPLLQAGTLSSPFRSVLIDRWDAVSAECLEAIQAASAIVLYDRPEFAQRQAQRLWDKTAASGDLTTMTKIRFFPVARRLQAYDTVYDLILRWIPFAQYEQSPATDHALEEIAKALRNGGLAIVAGPARLEQSAMRAGIPQNAAIPFSQTAGVGMLQAILPKLRVHPDAMLFLLRKRSF